MLREISIDGAPKIGEGAHGEVFRIADDTIACGRRHKWLSYSSDSWIRYFLGLSIARNKYVVA